MKVRVYGEVLEPREYMETEMDAVPRVGDKIHFFNSRIDSTVVNVIWDFEDHRIRVYISGGLLKD